MIKQPTTSRSTVSISISDEVRDRIISLAESKGLSTDELFLEALANEDDKELAELAKAELEQTRMHSGTTDQVNPRQALDGLMRMKDSGEFDAVTFTQALKTIAESDAGMADVISRIIQAELSSVQATSKTPDRS
jgi:hypothetical protein